MEQRVTQDQSTAAARADFDLLCRTIADAQPPPSHGFVALLEMGAGERFASQEIAALISRDPEFGANLQASHNANTQPGPSQRPFSAREVIDHWGYRVIHSSSVANGLVKLLGEDAFDEPHREYWHRAFAVASYAAVLAEVLQTHDDYAFSGSLLRSSAFLLIERHAEASIQAARDLAGTDQIPLWKAEAELLGGSHLELGRLLYERCGLSSNLLDAFEPAGSAGSLADLLFRATAAAERHGFEDPRGPTIPHQLRPDREPILDAYFRNAGGTVDGVLLTIRGMLAITPLVDLSSAA